MVHYARIVLARSRKGMLLAYNDYLFSRNRKYKNTLYWRCVEKTCSVFLHASVFVQPNVDIPLLREPLAHNHQPCPEDIQERHVIAQMIDVVSKDPCAPVRNAYDIVTAGPSVTDATFPFSSVVSLLNRRRSEFFPPIPEGLLDVKIEHEWADTWKRERFLSLLENNWGLAVFMTNKDCKLLLQCDTVFIDGTFRTAPHPYTQLLTVHGLFRGSVVPLCFSLVCGKTTAQYRQIFQHIIHRVRTVCHRRWAPATVICDFEIGLITALETELPSTRIRGCYFHYTQSLWRKVSSLGLVKHYRGNGRRSREIKKIVQKLMSIGYLPSLVIARAFQV
jgi:hypothetical protein